jgi:hypothetical protein
VSTFSHKYSSAIATGDAGTRQADNGQPPRLSLAGWPAAGAAKAAQLWLIEIAGCEIHLVGSDAELRNLLRRRPVTGETQVYEVGARPRALQNVPELARLLPQAADSEPPIRRPHPRVETRSPERAKLSEELAVLNRPLEDDVEYDDEVGRSRAKPLFAAVMFVAALAGAGYLLLAQRDRAGDEAAARHARQGEPTAPIGARLPASASDAVVPAKTPATEPAAARTPVAPIAASAAAKAGSTTSGNSPSPEPEGDPPAPSATAAPSSGAPSPTTPSLP